MKFQKFEKIEQNNNMILGGSRGEIYTVFDEESESEVENLPKPQGDQNVKV